MLHAYKRTKKAVILVLFVLVMSISLRTASISALPSSETLGHISKLTINYKDKKLENFTIGGIKVIDEITFSDFGKYSGKNFDEKLKFWTFATTKFSIMFNDSSPTDVTLNLNPGVDVIIKFHDLKSAYIVGSKGHVEGDHYVVDMTFIGADKVKIVNKSIKVRGSTIFSTLILMDIKIIKESSPKYFDDLSYRVLNESVENITVDNTTIIREILLGEINSSTLSEYAHVLKGSLGIVTFNDPQGLNTWSILICSLNRLKVIINGSLTRLYGPYKFHLYKLNDNVTLQIYGNYLIEGSTLVLFNRSYAMISSIEIPGLKKIDHLESMKLHNCSIVVKNDTLYGIKYNNTWILANISAGKYIYGFMSKESLYLMFERCFLVITPKTLSFLADNITLDVPSILLREYHVTYNDTYVLIRATEIIPIEIGKELSRVRISGFINAFFKLVYSATFSNNVSSIDITSNGNITGTVLGLRTFVISVPKETFIGVWKDYHGVLFWNNSYGEVFLEDPYIYLVIYANQCVILIPREISAKMISNNLVLLQHNNKTYSVVSGENVSISDNKIIARGILYVTIGPQIEEHLISASLKRYGESVRFSPTHFEGRYVEFDVIGTEIMHYTALGIRIIETIDLFDMLKSNLTPPRRNGCSIVINNSIGSFIASDTFFGVIKVSSNSPITVHLMLPESLLVLHEVSEKSVSYSVLGINVRIIVEKGNISLEGPYVIVKMKEQDHLIIQHSPLACLFPDATLKVLREENIQVLTERHAGNAYISPEIVDNKSLKILKKGPPIVLDVEIDPSLRIVFYNISNMSVEMDKKILQQVNAKQLLTSGYMTYFDGKSLHIVVNIPGGEHTIAIRLPIEIREQPQNTSSPSPTPITSPFPTPSTTSAQEVSPRSKNIVITGIIISIIVVSIIVLAYGHHRRS